MLLPEVNKTKETRKANTKTVNYRKIAEEYFQKKLLQDEVVHHIDGNHNNNEPENLVIMKKTQHLKLHGSLYSGLSEGRKEKNRPKPCNTCFFVKLYEEWLNNKSEENFVFVCIIANNTLFNIKKDEHSMEILYLDSKKWKKENKHDCYLNKNMEVVKG